MTRPMNIAILVDRNLEEGTGGAETFTRGLLMHLSGSGHAFHLVAREGTRNRYPGVHLHTFRPAPFLPNRIVARQYGAYIGSLKETLPGILQALRPDAILCGDPYAAYAVLDTCRDTLWYQPHSLLLDEFLYDGRPFHNWTADLNRRLLGMFWTFTEARLCREAHRLVAASRRLARRTCSVYRIPRERIVVVPMAIEGPAISPAGPVAPVNGKKTVLSVARMIPSKNPLLIPPVLAELGEEWQWVAVGDGPCRRELSAEAKRMGVEGRLHLPGGTREVGNLFRSCDVFAHLSRHENFGLVLLEALEAGKAPVVLDPSFPGVHTASDEFLREGRTAFFCAPDPKALADGILRAYREGADLEEGCRALVGERFRFPRYVERLIGEMERDLPEMTREGRIPA